MTVTMYLAMNELALTRTHCYIARRDDTICFRLAGKDLDLAREIVPRLNHKESA